MGQLCSNMSNDVIISHCNIELPLEIWKKISLESPAAYWVLVRTRKGIAMSSYYITRYFTKRVIHRDRVMYLLPNGVKHVPLDKTIPTEIANGCKRWYYNGLLHRHGDLPALEYADGVKTWYHHGKIHRDNDLPAIGNPVNGTQLWYFHGVRHREADLPAVVWANGRMEWWYCGMLHRGNDKPAVVTSSRLMWYHQGLLHRIGDKPALITATEERWYTYGFIHREYNKHAIIRVDGTMERWQYGFRHVI